MQTFDTRFEAELRSIVQEERMEKLKELEAGGGVADYPSYRERVGYLRALKDLEEWCTVAQTKVSQR